MQTQPVTTVTTVFPPLPRDDIELTPDILYGSAPEGTACSYHPFYWRFRKRNSTKYPSGYYVYLGGKWVPFTEELRAVLLDPAFESRELVEFVDLPANSYELDGGQFAWQASVDFCQYVRVAGGWVHCCDLDRKKREGFAPGLGMWMPEGSR